MYNFYKVSRLLDPRQLSCISHAIDNFKDLPPFIDLEELQIYEDYQDDLPTLFDCPAFWNAYKSRFPLLEQIANKVIWMLVTSVDAKHSFSQYKHLLNKQRKSLTLENTKQLTMLYYNGDLKKRFEDC